LLIATLPRKFRKSSAIVVQAKKSMFSPSITLSRRKLLGGVSGSAYTVKSNTNQKGGIKMSQAQSLANKLWQLLPVVGADNTAVIYEAVEYLEDIAREE